jgi:hypothetical protein
MCHGNAVDEPNFINTVDGTYCTGVEYDTPDRRFIQVWRQDLLPTLIEHLETLFQKVVFFDNQESGFKTGHFELYGPRVEALTDPLCLDKKTN